MYSRKKKTFIKYGLLFMCIICIYNEWLVYALLSFSWPRMECGDVKDPHRILFVADPQILGEKSESWIARWDSDRYLSKTFSSGLKHVKPDVVVFLGDLMDEGSIGKPKEYDRYYKRFSNIFSLRSFRPNMTIFLPGDNDIGGEDELVTKFKTDRFKMHFGQPDVFKLGNIEFIKVNKLQYTFPKLGERNENIKVLLSHVPLFGLPSPFSAEAITKLKPHVVFSGHEHKSVHFAGDPNTGERTLAEPLIRKENSDDWPATWRFQLSIKPRVVNEIVVPTCSYRMGTFSMGYGAALIDRNGEAMCYSVLSLPSRFHHIILYAICICFVTVTTLTMFYCPIKGRSTRIMTDPELYRI